VGLGDEIIGSEAHSYRCGIMWTNTTKMYCYATRETDDGTVGR